MESIVRLAAELDAAAAAGNQEHVQHVVQSMRLLLDGYDELGTRYGEVAWVADDVLIRKPEWTEAQAHKWLEEHTGMLEQTLTQQGNEYFDYELGQEVEQLDEITDRNHLQLGDYVRVETEITLQENELAQIPLMPEIYRVENVVHGVYTLLNGRLGEYQATTAEIDPLIGSKITIFGEED